MNAITTAIMPGRNLFAVAEATVVDFPGRMEGPSQEEVAKITCLSAAVEKNYQQYMAAEDARNMMYLRGQFWAGDGYSSGVIDDIKGYQAQQNEVFPLVDTVASALAIDLPQVECADVRVRSYGVPSRQQDRAIEGRRIAAPLNYFAEQDDLDETVHQSVVHAMLFRKGGIVKCSWSPDHGGVIWRTRMPWEVFFDTTARRTRDMGWAFERFVIHRDDLEARIEAGIYDRPGGVILPSTYPRSVYDEAFQDPELEDLRANGLMEYVPMLEFWDFKKGLFYHIHPDTRQVLLYASIPYARPYSILTFHYSPGRMEGIPDVSLMAPCQRDINELVSARREIVARLPRRMLVDRKLFRSEEDFERFKNSRTWEPTLVDVPEDRMLSEAVFVSPEMPTTFDFNKHLDEQREHLRYQSGLADFQRGQAVNIRTAAEAMMVRAAVEGRMNKSVRQVVKFVDRLFHSALEATQWAFACPQESGCDIQTIWNRVIDGDVDVHTWRDEVVEASPTFRILPFSPMMEDRITRRAHLERLIPMMASTPIGQFYDWKEVARDVQEGYALRPSTLLQPGAVPPATPTPAQPVPTGMPPALPPGPLGSLAQVGAAPIAEEPAPA